MKTRSYFTHFSVLSIVYLTCLTSCGALPQLLTTAEDVIDDNAITVTVSREAIQRQTNIKATVELDNGQLQTK